MRALKSRTYDQDSDVAQDIAGDKRNDADVVKDID
jgi:hypothetical protein